MSLVYFLLKIRSLIAYQMCTLDSCQPVTVQLVQFRPLVLSFYNCDIAGIIPLNIPSRFKNVRSLSRLPDPLKEEVTFGLRVLQNWHRSVAYW